MESSNKRTSQPVSVLRQSLRLVLILSVAVAVMGSAALGTVGVTVVRGRQAGRRFFARRFVRLLQLLGPTFIKFGQTASTRQDTMPPQLCQEMKALFDAVPAMPKEKAAEALRAAYPGGLEVAFKHVDREPVASGSIACVYHAVLNDGREVALKLKRPGIDRRMQADLALFRGLAKIGEKMPKMRGMPMADLIGYISRAILGQLDFDREAANLVRLRDSLAEMPLIRVPQLVPEWSRPDCLVLEYIPGLDAATPQKLSGPARARLASALLMAAHKMMFVDGFVHCDLHPGNVYLTAAEQVVILDAGYSVQLPDQVRRLIGEFFERLPAGDGRRCGEIVVESAVNVGPHTDTEGFISSVTELVARNSGPDAEFDMPVFGNSMYDLQQKYGLYAASDFAFPLMSMVVLEGTVRGFNHDTDFRQVGTGEPVSAGQPADTGETALETR